MKILIVEDEEMAARRLDKLIRELAPDADIVGALSAVMDTVNWLDANPSPDLIFMDIHLADGDSFSIFEHTVVEAAVVFTTAYDQYALRAFRVQAIDYLLKPIKREELAAAIQKYRDQAARKSIDYQQLAQVLRGEQAPRRFLIRLGQQLYLLPAPDIAYAYTDQKMTFFITHEGRRLPSDHSLDQLEEMLSPQDFFRINRQFIVNVAAIRELHAYSKSRVKLDLHPPTDLEAIVSTERSPLFKKWLQGH